MKKTLAYQILIALVIGTLIGHFFPRFGMALQPLGDAFIRLIKLIVVPLVFSTMVAGAAGNGAKRMGTLGFKTIAYFEIITTTIMGIGLVFVNLLQPGKGISLRGLATKDISVLGQYTSTVIDFKQLILNIIPTNIVDAMAKGNLLAVIFFSVLVGIAANAIGKKAEPVLVFLEALANIMFKITQMVMLTAPIGVLGLMAHSVGQYGIALLLPLAKLIGTVYLGLAFLILVFFPFVAWIFKIRYWELLKYIWDLVLITFATTSTETILPQFIDRMERYGCPRRVPSFVIPAAISLNADGSTLYLSITSIFIAQAFGFELSLYRQLAMIAVLIVTSKGLASVPSASLVVLLATCTAVGLPAEGVAIVAGIDRVLDMARSSVNTPGNALACIIVSKWEKIYRGEGWDKEKMMVASAAQS
jgi:proton glutamate symport protein